LIFQKSWCLFCWINNWMQNEGDIIIIDYDDVPYT
jgi:hypothetical protein